MPIPKLNHQVTNGPETSIWSGPLVRWIGLGENLQETPIFNGKNHGFL